MKHSTNFENSQSLGRDDESSSRVSQTSFLLLFDIVVFLWNQRSSFHKLRICQQCGSVLGEYRHQYKRRNRLTATRARTRTAKHRAISRNRGCQHIVRVRAVGMDIRNNTLLTVNVDTDIDIIPMAFMTQVTSGPGNTPTLNFANQQNDCTTFTGTNLINCPQIGDDIKACQQQYGKKILLSIGGATYTEGGFASSSDATAAADNIWQMFGPRNQSQPTGNVSLSATLARRQQNYHFPHLRRQSTALRPFGDAVLDGFDFDFESPVTNVVPFAARLRALMDQDCTKDYFLTAAPQ